MTTQAVRPELVEGLRQAQPERNEGMRETRSTCPYCGVGCGVIISSDGQQIKDVRGDPDHPANFGRLCTKGSTLHLTASAAVTQQTRLLQPMQRLNRHDNRHGDRQEKPQAIGWDAALDLAAGKFSQVIQDHGPDAVGFYISGQLLTEDYYVFNKLAKGLIGTNNVDTNSRLYKIGCAKAVFEPAMNSVPASARSS